MYETKLLSVPILALSLLAFDPETNAAADELTALPAGELDWKNTPEGVAFAALVGDRFTEPYMAMVRLPAGLVSPAHTKTANMFGIVVSGSMTHRTLSEDDSEAVILQTGSFYRIPRNVPHVSSCVSDVDCVTFLYQDGKFDFLPVSN